MFWRQATNAKVFVDAYGRTLVFAAEGSETNDAVLVYNPSTGSVMVGEVEVIEGIENWGTTEITVTTVDSVITFTVDGTEYTADSSGVTPAVTEWVPILHYAVMTALSTYAACDEEGKFYAAEQKDQSGTVVPGSYAIISHYDGDPGGATNQGWQYEHIHEYATPGLLHIVPATGSTQALDAMEFQIGDYTVIANGDYENPINTTPVQLT